MEKKFTTKMMLTINCFSSIFGQKNIFIKKIIFSFIDKNIFLKFWPTWPIGKSASVYGCEDVLLNCLWCWKILYKTCICMGFLLYECGNVLLNFVYEKRLMSMNYIRIFCLYELVHVFLNLIELQKICYNAPHSIVFLTKTFLKYFQYRKEWIY